MAHVSHPLPPPTKCDNCNSKRIRLYRPANQPARYMCRRCKASVYCHKGTTIPQGYMAPARTRYLRAKAHEAFDPLWLHNLLTRDAAYEWMARQLFVKLKHAHIGRLGDDDLERLIVKAARYYRKLKAKTGRREATQNATNRRQRTRTRKYHGKWKPK